MKQEGKIWDPEHKLTRDEMNTVRKLHSEVEKTSEISSNCVGS
jgi:hypothetical protein